MRELLHILLGKSRTLFPSFHPRPSLHIGDRVFSFSLAGEVVFGGTGVFAGELDFEHAKDAEGFVCEAFDGVFDFFGGGAEEVVGLALVST